MIIDRGPQQPPSTGKRPIIYSSATLTLCGSPPPSPDPFRSPLRQGLQHSTQPPAAATSSTPATNIAPPVLSPSKPIQAQTPLSPQKEKEGLVPHTTPLENMHLTRIKELEAHIENLTEAVAAANAAAEKNAASGAEWRSKALEAEAKLSHYVSLEVADASSQRSKLVEELKTETALWRRKFDELLEEHSALQARLESTTTQKILLDKALTTVRGDTADAVTALATAEALITRKNEEFEAYKKEKEALAAEAAATADSLRKKSAEKEKLIEDLTLENQKLTQQVDLLKIQVERLNLELFKAAEKEKERKVEKATEEILLVLKDDGGSTLVFPKEKALLKEQDINIYRSHQTVEKATKKDSSAALPAPSAPIIKKENDIVLNGPQQPEILQPPAASPPPPAVHDQAPTTRSHFDTAKALIARTAELEDSLMTFNIERSALETELAKFPSGTAGKTVADRKRKKEIEQRVEVLNKEISSVRLELRKLGIR